MGESGKRITRKKKRRGTRKNAHRGVSRVEEVISFGLGTLCALMLGAIFYGVLAYQSADEATLETARTANAPAATAAPLEQGVDMRSVYPGRLMALGTGTLTGEHAQDVRMGGQTCRVVERSYTLAEGLSAKLTSAWPAAYAQVLAAQGYEPQLITGFALAGLDAVYAVRGGECMLMAREGDCVYTLTLPDEQSVAYSLGAGAVFE